MTTDLRSRDPGPELPGLGSTLARAADQDLDLGGVRARVDGLVVHRRRRRRQLAGAVAAAAAVAVGGGATWLLTPERDLGQVAQRPPAVTAAPTTAPRSASSAPPVPSTTAATTAPPPTSVATTSLPYELVPDDVVLTVAEVGGDPLRLQQDLVYADIPVVQGQMCNQGLPGLVPSGGRTLGWFDPALQEGGSVFVNVTVFEPGAGENAFTEVVDDTGRCRWVDGDATTLDSPWEGPDRVVVRGGDVFGAAVHRAVVRVSDVLVGVEVNHPGGAEVSLEEVQRVADLVAARVASSGMPAAR